MRDVTCCLIIAVCIWMKSMNKNPLFPVNPRHEVLQQRHCVYHLKALSVMSHGCRFVLCASGDSVKVYSTRTEEWLHSLQGHTNQVTGIAFNPANHLQVCVLYLSLEMGLFWLSYFIPYINNRDDSLIKCFLLIPLQVYSCSADGTVKLWDFIDGILIKVRFVLWKTRILLQ